MIRRPPKSPLFPYPTLSRSPRNPAVGIGVVRVVAETRGPPILERAEVHVVAEGPGGGDGERERQGGARRHPRLAEQRGGRHAARPAHGDAAAELWLVLRDRQGGDEEVLGLHARPLERPVEHLALAGDRKSTRLNSSHLVISYAVFCLKKKKNTH